ncbi:MAG: hypothetical protein UU47_C0015G0014 [candidate division TM6 bacterium GW2011_GWE2_41_16]|nr:MAG: hypothetical protein UU47_C0015G0014 [candidate division TM6 bacterium GW2011_GWE2_41_16]
MMMHLTPQMYRMARQIALALVAVLVFFVGIGAYKWYAHRYEEKAHKTFARALDIYDQAAGAQGDAKTALIDRAYDMFEKTASTYSRSSYAPLCGLYQAQIKLDKGDAVTAQDMLKSALSRMPRHTFLTDLYTIKRALLMTDSDADDIRATGEKILTEYVADKKSAFRDMALFYLGKLKYDALDYDGACTFWDPLIKEFGSDDKTSNWARRALDLKEYRA